MEGVESESVNVTETIERLVSESLSKSLGNLDAQLEHLIQEKVNRMMTTISSSNATHGVTEPTAATSSNTAPGAAEQQLTTAKDARTEDHGSSEQTNKQVDLNWHPRGSSVIWINWQISFALSALTFRFPLSLSFTIAFSLTLTLPLSPLIIDSVTRVGWW